MLSLHIESPSYFLVTFVLEMCNRYHKEFNVFAGDFGYKQVVGGRTGLMVRASDSGSGDPGSILGRVGVFVSLSKRHLLPKSTGNTQE